MKQFVMKSVDIQCVTLWSYVKRNNRDCCGTVTLLVTDTLMLYAAALKLGVALLSAGHFGKLCVSARRRQLWSASTPAEKRQCFMSSSLHISLHIRWRACDLSGMGNICAYCHTGMKASYCLQVKRHCRGKPKGLHMTGASSRQKDLKWITFKSTKTFSFYPFLISTPSITMKCPFKASVSKQTVQSGEHNGGLYVSISYFCGGDYIWLSKCLLVAYGLEWLL